MRVLLIPDSFKGSMSQLEVCEIMAKAIASVRNDIEAVKCPIADGGEGTLSCFKDYFCYRSISLKIHNHLNEPIISEYGYNGDIAAIEVAKACGLTIGSTINPYISTTFGVGELILSALKRKPKGIILTLGGSATNDLGIGMSRALGAKYYSEGKEVAPNILRLNEITDIDLDSVYSLIKNTPIIAITDVNNPLCGPNGATKTFGPQKGVRNEDLDIIDQGFLHISNLLKKKYNIDYSTIGGAGAAGGLGYAALAFLKGRLMPGIETILDMLDIDEKIINSDYIITGEGSFDSQSLNGKVIDGILKRCKKYNKKLIIVCGVKKIDPHDDNIYLIEEIKRENESIEDSILNAKNNLFIKMQEIARVL